MNKFSDFDIFFNTYLSEQLNDYEKLRIIGIKKFKIFVYISLSFLLLLILAIIVFPEPFLLFLLGFPFIAIFGFGVVKIKKLRKDLRPKFKKTVLLPILKNLYQDIEYIPRQRMAKSVLNNSLLLKEIVHRTIGDDFVRCRIGETMIQFSEIEAYHGGNVGLFYAGIFISASFNKKFKTKTLVLPKKISNRTHRLTLKYRGQMENPEIVKLEDPIFNEHFIVISEDQIESRYLLSTSLMQRLLDYEQRFKKEVSFSFINNRLYISIPINVNMFEPRIFEPINDKEFIKYNYDYFKLLTDVVEELDLNTRIWI